MTRLAYLNHGRWVVDCPADDCEATLFADRPMFAEDNNGTLSLRCICNDVSVCDHSAVPCGTPLAAVFPDNRADIDRLMAGRRRRNRNWTGESVSDLKAENLLHGVAL